MAKATYTLIDSVTLSGTTSSISFTNPDTSYGDLVLVADYGITSQGQAEMRINGGTTNHYWVNMYGTGGSYSSAAGSSANYIPLSYGAFSNPGHTPMAIVQILDYSATDKHKFVLVRNGNGDTGVEAVAGVVAATSAVTTILVYASSQFTSGSTFFLYGIAKAL